MELNFNLLLVLLAFLSLLFALLEGRKTTKTENRNSKLPPGPWKLPIIGCMHHLIGPKLIHHTFSDLAKKHGPLMYLKLGQVSVVVISSAKMVQEALKTHDLMLADRPSTLHMRIFSYDNSGVGVTPYGSAWRQRRKICVQELLGANRVKAFQVLMEDEVSNLIASISSSIGTHINLNNKVLLLTSSIIARAAFGKKYKNHERFLSAVKQGLELLTAVNIADFFPSLEFLNTFSGSTSKCKATHKQVDMILDEIIEDHIRQRAIRNHIQEELDDKREEDLVDVLLRFQESGDLETDNIKAIIFDMYSGGTDTAASTLISVMSELVKNPRVMAKAQAEVRRALAGNAKLDRSIFDGLSYLKCIIKENFRLHPPGPLLLPREVRESCQIRGYTIPSKTKVLVNAWALGRDPQYWKDAKTFYPERFEGSSIEFKGANFEFVPFGTGRRICPGISFAQQVLELVLVQLLYHFNWELPNGIKGEELDMTEVLDGFIVQRKYDLVLLATPYAPLQE